MSWQDDALKLVTLAVQAKSLGDELTELASKIIKKVEIEAGPEAEIEINISEKEAE